MQAANHTILTNSQWIKYLSPVNPRPATDMRDPVWGSVLTIWLCVLLIPQLRLQLWQSHSQDCEAWKTFSRCGFGSDPGNFQIPVPNRLRVKFPNDSCSCKMIRFLCLSIAVVNGETGKKYSNYLFPAPIPTQSKISQRRCSACAQNVPVPHGRPWLRILLEQGSWSMQRSCLIPVTGS